MRAADLPGRRPSPAPAAGGRHFRLPPGGRHFRPPPPRQSLRSRLSLGGASPATLGTRSQQPPRPGLHQPLPPAGRRARGAAAGGECGDGLAASRPSRLPAPQGCPARLALPLPSRPPKLRVRTQRGFGSSCRRPPPPLPGARFPAPSVRLRLRLGARGLGMDPRGRRALWVAALARPRGVRIATPPSRAQAGAGRAVRLRGGQVPGGDVPARSPVYPANRRPRPCCVGGG